MEERKISKTLLLTCSGCGREFVFRRCEQETFALCKRSAPKYCPQCYSKYKQTKAAEAKRAEDEKSRLKREIEQAEFERQLRGWNVVGLDKIIPEDDNVLYIIGNGFDLMHRVKSSYYNFRDTLGKRSALRETLETYITTDDLWADFEASLAHFNLSAMSNGFVVDNFLDMFEAYDEDAGAAEFFMAAEAAATPMITLAEELPKRFRKWVNTLSVGTDDRPLRDIFTNGKVLCFNYTEFVETLYNVGEDKVCYIHGCRKRQKGKPADKLILGHMSGASDVSYEISDNLRNVTRSPYRRAMIEAAQENVISIVSECDSELTKNCSEIILRHSRFFEGLKDVKRIISIGHSFLPVDRDYFIEVCSRLANSNKVLWAFGCYGLNDLNNLSGLLSELGISRSKVAIFRTDTITTTPKQIEPKPLKTVMPKKLCESSDGQWTAHILGGILYITDKNDENSRFEFTFSTAMNGAFFLSSDRYLIAYNFGFDAGIYLFGLTENGWRFIEEFENIPNQRVLNSRLKRVFLNGTELTFVYNSRIRKYSLETGELIFNKAVRFAPAKHYAGNEITSYFPLRRYY